MNVNNPLYNTMNLYLIILNIYSVCLIDNTFAIIFPQLEHKYYKNLIYKNYIKE